MLHISRGEGLHRFRESWRGIAGMVTAGTRANLEGRMRLQALPVWGNGCLCPNGVPSCIGLQLPLVVRSLPASSMAQASKLAVLVLVGIVLVRFAWILAQIYLPRRLSRTFRHETPWQHTA